MWQETGTVRSVISGFNLYPFLMATQTVNAFLTNPPKDGFIGNAYESNKLVHKLVSDVVGWKQLEPSQDILDACSATKNKGKQNDEKRIWYHSPSSSLPKQARIIIDCLNKSETGAWDRKIKGQKTGETLVLDTSEFTLANHLRPHLQELAYGKFGQYLEASPDIPLIEARRQLEDYMKGPQNNPSLAA